MLFKETMFFFSAYLAFLGFVFSKNKNYLLVTFFGLLALVLYLKVLPFRYFNPTFDASNRICSFDEFLDLGLLNNKLTWLFNILLPLAPILVFGFKDYKKVIIYSFLLAAPFFAPVLISNFAPMFHLYNYYSFNPLILLFVSILCAVKLDYRALLIACLITLFIGPRFITIIDIKNGLSEKTETAITKISNQATVIADQSDLNYFIENKRLIRIYHANKNQAKFDYIAYRKNVNPPRLSLFLRSWSEICYEDEKWVIRCAKSKMKANQSLVFN